MPYPPGMSKRDFIRAGIDEGPHHHECEFYPEEGPILEDGAAIFIAECEYADRDYSCDETESFRFDYDRLILPDGEEIVVRDVSAWDYEYETGVVGSLVVAIENEHFGTDGGIIESIDPDPHDGQVVLKTKGGIQLVYNA